MKIKALIQKFASDSLARNSAIVLVGTMGANALSYLYHLIMGRLLGPSGYGELSSLISLVYIFTVPLIVAQTVLVKFVSGFKAHGDVGQAKTLLVKATRFCIIVSLIGLPVVYVAAPWVMQFLHLSSTTLLMWVYALLAVSLLSVVTASVLSGYQMFLWMSGLTAFGVLIKLLVSIPLAAWRVPGVLIAAVIASIVSYLFYYFPLRKILAVKGKPTKLKSQDAFGFAVPTLLTQLGITSIYTTDIILVRHFFDPQSAGLYAALAILGKIIFYASSAVPVVLFPIAAERASTGARTHRLIVSAVGAVAAISAGITVFYFLFPNFIVGLLFGNAYTGAGSLLGMFGVFLALFSIGNIFATSCLAVGKLLIWIFASVAAVIQIIAITLFHATIAEVIWINIGITLLYDLAAGGYYFLSIEHEKV